MNSYIGRDLCSPVEETYSHSFVFSKSLYPGQGHGRSEPVPETLNIRWEYSLDDAPCHHSAPLHTLTCSFTPRGNLKSQVRPLVCFLGGGRKLKNQEAVYALSSEPGLSHYLQQGYSKNIDCTCKSVRDSVVPVFFHMLVENPRQHHHVVFHLENKRDRCHRSQTGQGKCT